MSDTSYTITSPVMGVFYQAASPEDPPLVEVGRKVQASDVVCLIESMKIFTELRSEKAGVVRRILVENEEPVMKNQALMEIDIEG